MAVLCLALLVSVPGLPTGLWAQENPSSEVPSIVLLDPAFSPRAGVTTFDALARGLYLLEDRYLPVRIGDDRGVEGFLGLLYRFGRLTLIDNPLVIVHTVVRHEIGGHGGRVRQLGGDVLEYRFELPPPYGDGGGSIRFQFEDPVPYELALSAAGGLESAHLDQSMLEERWAARGRMDFREALRYLTATAEIGGYIGSASSRQVREGHDVENYVALVNTSFPGEFESGAMTEIRSGRPVSVSDLQDATAVELLNPAFLYSIYAVLWRFLVRGESDAGLPALDLGSVRAMPTVHLRLTPFGVEYAGGVLTAWGERVVGAKVRVGDGPWGTFRGLEFSGRRLYLTSRLRVGAEAGLWRQYDLDASTVDPRWGGLAMLRGSFTGSGWPVSAVAELGYKTAGYMPGEDLDAGPVLRIGVAAEL